MDEEAVIGIRDFANGRLWPFAAPRDFPKADVRAAGFGKSSHSTWVRRKGQYLSLELLGNIPKLATQLGRLFLVDLGD